MLEAVRRAALLILAGVLILSTAFGCRGQNSAPPEGGQVTILVAAAASLEQVLAGEIIPMFEREHNRITVIGTYDSSGRLQAQIEAGMQADVFMPAAMRQMDELVGRGFVDADSVVRLLENQIVLIAPAGEQSSISGFPDVLSAEIIAVGDPESVPAGQYAREVFTYFGIWDEVLQRASVATNVTQVLHWVAEGGAQAGIVYATDAALTAQVQIIATAPPQSLSAPVTNPVGIVSATGNREAAELFLEFLRSPQAMEVFERHGFLRAY